MSDSYNTIERYQYLYPYDGWADPYELLRSSLRTRLALDLTGLEAAEREKLENWLWSVVRDAANEIMLELNVNELEERFFPKVVDLAAVRFLQAKSAEKTGFVSSWSFSEGQVSESEKYLTQADYDKQAQGILDSLKRYRQVRC